MFACSQLDFFAISVSISVVSLTSRQTWQNVNSKRRFQRIQNVHEGKRHQKQETSSCFCLCSFCFWGEVSNSWNLNDIGRNFLLGNRKKIAKCLMRTFAVYLPLYLPLWHAWITWGLKELELELKLRANFWIIDIGATVQEILRILNLEMPNLTLITN